MKTLPSKSIAVVVTLITVSFTYSKTPESISATVNELQMQADTKIDAEKYDEAITLLNKAIKLDSKDPKLFISRSIAKNFSSDFKGAISDTTTALQIDPKNGEAYYIRGNTKRSLKDEQSSITDFNKTIALEKSNSNLKKLALAARASAKRALKDYKGALNDYNTVIEIDPTNANAYYFRAHIKLSLKRIPEAILDLEKSKSLGNPFAENDLNSLYTN